MLLFIKEQEAITQVVKGFDQFGFDAFLAKAGAPTLSTFSLATLPIPVVALNFIQWLYRNDGFIGPVLRTLVLQFPAHP